jgi:hypothetical protein
MTERTWEKYGAATGIAFGLLLLVAIFAAPQPPHIDASSQKILGYYADHRHAVLTAGVFGAFSTLAAVLFISHLRHVFDRVEHGIEGLAAVVYAAGIGAVAASMLGGVVQTSLAFTTAQPGDLIDGGTARVMYDLVWVSNGMTFMLAALWLAAIAVGMVRGEVATPVLGWFAAAVSLLSVVGGVGLLTVSSYSAAWSAIGLAAIVGVALWTIVAGASMIAHPEVETVARHRSIIATSH